MDQQFFVLITLAAKSFQKVVKEAYRKIICKPISIFLENIMSNNFTLL